ncbi:MAG: DUF4236 domain-containing protein [Gemmatimonadota bacterium]
MGWTYRKSIRLGPMRINLRSRGVGYSIGGPGFRVGVRANGRRYVSSGIPGTGLRYQQSLPASNGCAIWVAVALVALPVVWWLA